MNPAVHDMAARDRRLPGLSTLLDPVALAEAVGAAAAHIRHVRYKPGTSVLAAFTTPDGAFWAGAWAGPDKPRSAQQRSSAVAALADVPWSAVGPARSDRVLVRGLVDAAAREPVWRDAAIVRHNPGRRLVARTGGEYAKTAPGRARTALDNADRLLRAGVPTLAPRLVAADTWATATWGDGDLAATRSGAHARATGAALARLHRAPTHGAADAEGPGARALSAVRAVRTVLPEAGPRADAHARRLPAQGRRTLVHGDFSADQVLTGPESGIRLIDLDRMGLGDPALDIAGFAVEEYVRSGKATVTTALFAAYLEAGGPVTEAEWRAWTPLCVLERAIEPFRKAEHDWPSAVAERLDRAEDLR